MGLQKFEKNEGEVYDKSVKESKSFTQILAMIFFLTLFGKSLSDSLEILMNRTRKIFLETLIFIFLIFSTLAHVFCLVHIPF